jgi:MFS family permease
VTGPDHPDRRGWRWAVAAGLAAVAASTLTTTLAAAAAGHESDLALLPVERSLRVTLLLIAPCVGAVLAAVVVPVSGGGRLAAVAVGLGVPLGPLLVLRLDRVRDFGLVSSLLTMGVMVAWGAIGAALAAGWWTRPGRRVQRTDLPPPAAAEAADHLEASGEPGPRGPAA